MVVADLGIDMMRERERETIHMIQNQFPIHVRSSEEDPRHM